MPVCQRIEKSTRKTFRSKGAQNLERNPHRSKKGKTLKGSKSIMRGGETFTRAGTLAEKKFSEGTLHYLGSRNPTDGKSWKGHVLRTEAGAQQAAGFEN